MTGRLIVAWLLVGWLVFGMANRAAGQVVLESTLEIVSETVELGTIEPITIEPVAVEAVEDRYGDYEPVSLTAEEGPLLLSQIEDWVQPPGQRPSSPTVRANAEPPVPTPVPESPPLLLPAPAAPAPWIYDVPPPMAMPRRSCPPWRPCGPQESFGGNWFVKQGFAGADFRGACDFHDRCLLSGCYDRKTCDRRFLMYMDNACYNSAFPILCRIKAREMYLGVRLFGWLY